MEQLQVSSEVLVGFGLLFGSFTTIAFLLFIEIFKSLKH